MELIVIIVIAFLIGKSFGAKKQRQQTVEVYEQPRKKSGCSTLLIVAFVFVLFVLFSSSDSSTTDSPQSASPTAAPTSAPAAVTAAPTPDPTAAPIPSEEPTTLQGWAESVAQEIYGQYDSPYTNLISVSCEQVDGDPAPMITINVKYPDTFMRTNDERMSSFLYNVMRTVWKLNDLASTGKIEYGSVFIHGRAMFADQNGNESEADAAQIRIKASEAAKVNWSFDSVTGDMMPGIAVSFGMQPVIREGLTSTYYNTIRK